MSRGQLNFDLASLNASIENIENNKGDMVAAHTTLDTTIDNTLRPNWDTTSGVEMINKLEDFSLNTIKLDLIPYVEQKIAELRIAYDKMVQIDNA